MRDIEANYQYKLYRDVFINTLLKRFIIVDGSRGARCLPKDVTTGNLQFNLKSQKM